MKIRKLFNRLTDGDRGLVSFTPRVRSEGKSVSFDVLQEELQDDSPF